MPRSLLLGLVLGLLLGGSVLLWWGLHDSRSSPPTRQSIAGLSDTATIRWTAQQTALIEAPTPTDALAALGYVHGLNRSWVATIWRRTALGTLSSWFGEKLVPLDRHARQLGLARHARQAYDRLSDADRQRLQAYTRGLNAALQSNSVRQHGPFVSLDLSPQHWEPWHPLAVERLLAWVATDPPALPDSLSHEARTFWDADRRLHRWLHLHGWNRSLAWAARPTPDTAGTALFARHVLGTSADPLIQEVALRHPSSPTTVMATLPGTLLFPTGTTGGRAWAYLLDSPLHFDRIPVDSSRLRSWHERITPASGDEQLVPVRRHGETLTFDAAPPDSAWVLRWPGFRTRSDGPRWLTEANLSSRLKQERPPFHLFRGNGLTVDASGNWTVHGRPPVVEQTSTTVLVGQSSWAQSQAEALRTHRTGNPAVAPARWSASDSSAWAGALLPRFLPDLTPLAGTDSTLDQALTYLRNWDAAYAPPSIGAVLFERWMQAYRADIGRVPPAPKPPPFAAARRRQAFRQAVNELAAEYGRDVRRWRWERIAATHRRFLVWSADSLSRQRSGLSPLSKTRFAPLSRPPSGHASTLAGGPSLVDSFPLGPAPAQWDGWMRNGRSELTVRRLRFDPSAFFARALLPDEPPAPVVVSRASVTATTQLVPAQP